MKRLFFICMSFLFAMNMMAETITLNYSNCSSALGTNGYKSTDFTYDGLTYGRSNAYANNQGIQIQKGTSNAVWNKTEIPGAIVQIKVTKKTNNCTLTVGTSAKPTTNSKSVTSTTTYSFKESDNLRFFKIAATSSYTVVSSIEITYVTASAGCTPISPTLSYASPVTVGGTLSPTLTGNTGNGTVTYSIASGSGATVNSSTGVLTATSAGSVTVKATIAANGDYCDGTATSGTITISEPTYTITATSNNASLGTVSVSGKVITATPAACVGYASPAYEVTSGTATVSQSGNTFTVTASSNCNVQINFAESAKDIYIDKVHGTDMTDKDYCGTYDAPTIKDKDKVTASEQTGVCDHDHYHFVGWLATGITGSQENEPDGLIKAGTAMTASGKTYYAVWAQEK